MYSDILIFLKTVSGSKESSLSLSKQWSFKNVMGFSPESYVYSDSEDEV
jgi:hypothetical protein